MWPLNSRRSARTALKRWVAFNSVGTAGVAVQLTTLGVLSGWLGLDYRVATAAAVESAVLHNFAWHHRWTWADRGDRQGIEALRRLFRFNLTTGMVSLLGNLAITTVLVDLLDAHYLMANLLAIGICSGANFLVSDCWVFKQETRVRRQEQGE